MQRRRAEARRDRISLLTPTSLNLLASIPPQLLVMYDSVRSLPVLDAEERAALLQMALTEPGKRKWETSKTGYLNWAVSQLLAKRQPGTTPGIDFIHEEAKKTASTEALKAATQQLK